MTGVQEKVQAQFEDFNRQGFRVLGIAYRPYNSGNTITKEDEKDFIFLGFIVLDDPPKPGVADTIRN